MQDCIRLIVLGGGGVGKSSCTIYFMKRIFVEEYDPTVEDYHRKQIMFAENPVLVEIIDPTSGEEYCTMRDQFIRHSEGFLIFYSITCNSSFEQVQSFVEKVQRAKDADSCPWIMIGNKCDLESERQVETHEGEKMAEKYGALFFETSAKFGINVDEAVYALVSEVYQFREKNEIRVAPKARKQCVIC